jgi:hypothetical protein
MYGVSDLEKGESPSKTSDRSRSTTPQAENPVQPVQPVQPVKPTPSKFDAYMGRK